MFSSITDDNSSFQKKRMDDEKQGWLNTKEAAKYLGISVQNLRMKIWRGQIRPQGRLGRSLKFKKDALDLFLEIKD